MLGLGIDPNWQNFCKVLRRAGVQPTGPRELQSKRPASPVLFSFPHFISLGAAAPPPTKRHRHTAATAPAPPRRPPAHARTEHRDTFPLLSRRPPLPPPRQPPAWHGEPVLLLLVPFPEGNKPYIAHIRSSRRVRLPLDLTDLPVSIPRFVCVGSSFLCAHGCACVCRP